jgi:aspartate kinase
LTGDNKVTDLLYLCYAHLQYGVNYDSVLDRIRRRYEDIAAALGLKTDLAAQFTELRAQMDSGISQDALASRGEYLSALLMADYLGWEFLDAADFMRFRADGTVDLSQTTLLLREKAEGKRCVIPGFYGLLPSGRIKTFSRGRLGRNGRDSGSGA